MPWVGADPTWGIILPWRCLKTLLNGGSVERLHRDSADHAANTGCLCHPYPYHHRYRSLSVSVVDR